MKKNKITAGNSTGTIPTLLDEYVKADESMHERIIDEQKKIDAQEKKFCKAYEKTRAEIISPFMNELVAIAKSRKIKAAYDALYEDSYREYYWMERKESTFTINIYALPEEQKVLVDISIYYETVPLKHREIKKKYPLEKIQKKLLVQLTQKGLNELISNF